MRSINDPNCLVWPAPQHPMVDRLNYLTEYAEQFWREFNRCGELSPYGDPEDDVNGLRGIGELVWRAAPDMQPFAVYWDESLKSYHVIASCNGPCGARFDHL